MLGTGQVKNKGNILQSNQLELKIMGAGDLDLAIDVKTLTCGISGSGNIKLTGNATTQEIKISGAGDVSGQTLNSETSQVEISGSGSVQILVKKSLTAQISGSGDIFYKGNPKVLETKVSGSGKIKNVEDF